MTNHHPEIMTTGQQAARYVLLDATRCVAILLLLMSHIGQSIENPFMGAWFGISHLYRVSFGGLAVTIFLILSGLCLQLEYGSKITDCSRFLVKRFLRIYPVYYLSLVIGIPLFMLRSYYFTGNPLSGFSKLGLSDITLSLTGFYAYADKWGGPFVETSWFIALIMTMYLFFIFLSPIIEKHPVIAIVSLLFTSVVSRIIVSNTEFLSVRPMDWFPLCRVFEFSLGIYLATILPRSIWQITGPLRQLTPAIRVLSKLSLPLFLIHQPLLPIIDYLMLKSFSPFVASAVFLSVSLTASWAVFTINEKILTPFLSPKIRGRMVRA